MIAAFPAEEHEARVRAVREAMDEQGLDALLIASPESIYHLAGLSHLGHFAVTLLVLPLDGPPSLVARAMESPTLEAQTPHCAHVLYEDTERPAGAAVKALREVTRPSARPRGSVHPPRIGVERSSMSLPVDVWEGIRSELADASWVDASSFLTSARMVKSPRELEYVRRAAALSDRALQRGLAAAAEGVTEREVALAIHAELLAPGTEYPAIPPLVRATPTLKLEHLTWSDRPLARGDTLFLELSASVARYHAPLSRLAYVGEAPAGAERAAGPSLAGWEAIRGALRPGAVASDVYAAWQRAVRAALGNPGYRRHHCGYITGIGFAPMWSGVGAPVSLRPGHDLELRERMVFHVFSWILGEGTADYGVSDTLLVTADGCEVLTSTSREPAVLG